MMVVRLGFAPAVALALLTSVGSAGAQSYPVDAVQSAEPVPGTVEVPAAIDPYGTSGAVSQGGVAPIMAPAAAGVQPPAPISGYANGGNPAAGYPTGAYSGQPPAGYPAQSAPGMQAAVPAQAGYPAGAYSGQQPAGYPAPGYSSQAATPYGAPSAPAHAAAPAYSHPQPAYPAPQQQVTGANGASVAMLPPEDQPEEGPPKELPANLKRQVVDYVTTQPPGTIVIDTPNTYLYYVLPGGKAERYGIGVGRDGFTWAGTEKISRKAEWADWRPPAEMIERQPYLPRFMAGGPGNPLGARTMYLGGTIYRIHGTNQPSTIGQFMSSGCIRMLNEDVENLYDKVKVGTKVVVLPGNAPAKTADSSAAMQPTPVSTISPNAVPNVAVR
ncbi:lipoprotein-anchoring transpeptidase ErfK/SrfK [Ancylobacter sp. 3268]|uniref:L,D-transpeptidase family protein n=1 Tax=Ancylobacter sp. 3268 TaxID=2817752 RepID=UPI00285F4945|nr:L,D-transpeptidase family protein [Ancylobacter sp. 3268]MDR6954672.1 lipoprotein-anchoring transpeptidase ErfK/SrfK [Ancylobacter sp. 3268]